MKNKSNASADDGRFTSNTCTSANEFLQGRRNTPPHKRQEEVVIRQRRGLGGQMEAFPAVPQAQAPSERGVHNGSLYTQAPPASPVAVLLCMYDSYPLAALLPLAQPPKNRATIAIAALMSLSAYYPRGTIIATMTVSVAEPGDDAAESETSSQAAGVARGASRALVAKGVKGSAAGRLPMPAAKVAS
ncbi:hypothetical protein THAOC_30651, partial [Thalassiosira oceanica]